MGPDPEEEPILGPQARYAERATAVHADGGKGFQIGDGNFQINVFGPTDTHEVSPATPDEFRADVAALLTYLDDEARSGHLPVYLPASTDVTSMSRTVRTFSGIRNPGAQARTGRDLVYAAPASQGRPTDARSEPWERVAAQSERLMVLGDPGMGKSWLVRAETHRLARAAHAALESGVPMGKVIIPVPIRADVLADSPGKSLAEAAAGYLASTGGLPLRSVQPLQARIQRGAVVLLVDALDEVPRESAVPGGVAPRRRLEELLRRWVSTCTDAARCVLTSRLAGYSGPPIPMTREVELLPFTAPDVRAAIKAWNLSGGPAEKLDELLGNPAVAGMAGIPLLLALLCTLASNTSGNQPLPDTRTKLYDTVIWQFLSGAHRTSEIGSRVAATSPADRQFLLDILSHVAFTFATAREGWIDRLPYAAVVKAISIAIRECAISGASPTSVLAQLEHQAGVLVPAGNPALGEQPYMFLHRTIAEYLVARHLCGLESEDRMLVVKDHQWFDPDWSEVIPMLGGLLGTQRPAEAGKLVSHFLNRRPDPLWRGLRTALQILGETSSPDDLLSVNSAARLGRMIRLLLPREPHKDILDVDLIFLPVWPSALTGAVLDLLKHRRSETRSDIADLLVFRYAPGVTAALLDLANDKSAQVRGSAGYALAARSEPGVTDTLLRLAFEDEDDNEFFGSAWVREKAAVGLRRQQAVESGVTDTLIRRLADGGMDPKVAAALQGHLNQEQASALVRLLVAPDANTRACAAIALRSTNLPQATAALAQAVSDIDSAARKAANSARRFPDDDSISPESQPTASPSRLDTPEELIRLCRRRTWMFKLAMRGDCFSDVDLIVDRAYLQVPPSERTQVRRQLWTLTRSASHRFSVSQMITDLADRLD